MPNLVVLSGKVSGLTQPTPAGGGPRARHAAELRFRVAGAAARSPGWASVGEGDLVTIAGLYKEGALAALAIRNRSTGVDSRGPTALRYFGAMLLGGFGLAAFELHPAGLLLLVPALWLLRSAWRRSRAYRMVQGLPGANAGRSRPSGST